MLTVRIRATVLILSTSVVFVSGGFAGSPGQDFGASQDPRGNPNERVAKVDRAPLEWRPADRYQVSIVLQPLRKVVVMNPADGIVKALSVTEGTLTREGGEIGLMDPAEAAARLRIARAELADAERDRTRSNVVEAARGRLELAQIAMDRCTLRAPFAGRVTAVLVGPGQFVPKGTPLIEISDLSSVRALVPVNRSLVTPGATVKLSIEGKPVSGRATTLLPLPEGYAVLRELVAPIAAAWVSIDNPGGNLEPGERVLSPYLPDAPIATVPTFAIRQGAVDGESLIQVIRADRVVDVPARVLGTAGQDRSQISGAFRPQDVLIQSTSIPLAAGTILRFPDQPSSASGADSATSAPRGRPTTPDRPASGVVPF